MSEKDVLVLESEKIAGFTGEMSSAVVQRKIDEAVQKQYELEHEVNRLKTILFERKYSEMTIQEIAKEWDGDDDDDEIREDRRDMAFGLPELKFDYDDCTEYRGWGSSALYDEVFFRKWDNMHNSPFDVRPYFEKYAKK